MSMYITTDFRKEVIKRFEYIDEIEENLDDVLAELQELKQCDPLSKAKGSGDYKGKGSNEYQCSLPVALSMRKDALEVKAKEYQAIINDHIRGMRMLNNIELDVLTYRFKDKQKQETVARTLKCDRKKIRQIENEALRKMENHMVKL